MTKIHFDLNFVKNKKKKAQMGKVLIFKLFLFLS